MKSGSGAPFSVTPPWCQARKQKGRWSPTAPADPVTSGSSPGLRKAYQLKAVPIATIDPDTLLLYGLPPGVAADTVCPVTKLYPFCLRS